MSGVSSPLNPPGASGLASTPNLPGAPVAAWFRTAGVSPEQVGLVAVPLDGGAALLQHNPGQALNPASTIKLVTSYAALSMLGPDYRWRTGAQLRGRLVGDTLRGDLVLEGGGDPKLVVEDLAGFVERMREAGLRDLLGDLIIDDSLYDAGGLSVDPFDGDPSQPYNVWPNALLVNFKSTRVVVRPGDTGASITLDPPLAGVTIDNAVTLVAGNCRHGAADLIVRDNGNDAAPTVRVAGSYSVACGEQGVFTAVLTHRQFIEAMFRSAWTAAGGRWEGRARFERGAAQGAHWLEWISPRTLADVVGDILKFSNNVMSRQLMLQLATPTRPRGTGVTLERARGALRAWLVASGLDFPEVVIDNGAGLSRTVRISAASLSRVLRHAAASPLADVVRNALPVVGVDGTMKRRLLGEPLAGSAWIKTGSLSDVRAIAGYVDAASGRRYAVVMMVNGPRAEFTRAMQDDFLRWVHRHG